ncbi:hypothetical protein SR187_8850 [Streptococcus ruminantium]|uniref:Uncharacterized protein n=1 Tax=Streptococcus ruminantium TaxID=1917441 RepID=A0A2Z5U588_9STRE|nr:hypothetical protein SR187_8850 [Streptococcus ruminantium]
MTQYYLTKVSFLVKMNKVLKDKSSFFLVAGRQPVTRIRLK